MEYNDVILKAKEAKKYFNLSKDYTALNMKEQ